ncbi:hypothetical protein [Dickeya dadantii]|uniref:hypothetical protein n=1 Tax=Dickeya dadantii TaxID=204038 RepID=UPI0003A0C135|nr:hypothetical protein [Dickeya dadantii]
MRASGDFSLLSPPKQRNVLLGIYHFNGFALVKQVCDIRTLKIRLTEMTEEDIYPLLGKLADGRVYSYAVPCCLYHSSYQQCAFILFSLSQENNYNSTQQLANQYITVSVDCYAHTVAAARALREQVRTALAVLKPYKTVEYNDFDVEFEQFRMTLEVSVAR